MEILRPPRTGFQLRYAIFDHDGTLSVLRAGWEEHMFPVMAKAILGEKTHAPEVLKEVETKIRKHIEQQTGMPTLHAMEKLIPMIREAGHTPEGAIHSPEEYKRRYHLELDRAIHLKYESLRKGTTKPDDHMIAGAFSFLETLFENGVKLILASGSDESDVRHEAEILGFSKFFQGEIYGALDGTGREAKGWAMDRIKKDIGDEAMGLQVAVFGDGPVEMREGKKRGVYTVGLASNEVTRSGFYEPKRKRLVEAGADMLVGDFLKGQELLRILGR